MTDYREISAVLGSLGDLVDQARKQRGATLREIERRTGVTNSNVLRVTRGENCTVKHARALLAWLDDPEVTKEEIALMLGEDVPEKLPRTAPFTRPDSNVFVIPGSDPRRDEPGGMSDGLSVHAQRKAQRLSTEDLDGSPPIGRDGGILPYVRQDSAQDQEQRTDEAVPEQDEHRAPERPEDGPPE